MSTATITSRGQIVWRAVKAFRDGAAAAGCEKTMTFDRAAAKHAGMTLLT